MRPRGWDTQDKIRSAGMHRLQMPGGSSSEDWITLFLVLGILVSSLETPESNLKVVFSMRI